MQKFRIQNKFMQNIPAKIREHAEANNALQSNVNKKVLSIKK